MSEIEEWTLQRTAEECETHLQGLDVPCSRYRTLAENLDQPYLLERGTLRVVEDGAGPLTIPAAPFQMKNAVVRPQSRVPRLGEDTADVLHTVLGYGEAQIDRCVPMDAKSRH